ncbi:hypothetical protein PFISCL1PPCAC_15557, partial [Pristionchus fissidentatus]
MKTTVMMIGEFEFTGIFHGDDRLYTTSMAYPLFLIFAILMTILLMNLLVGLAVDDIKGVQEQAGLKRLSMQVDLVLQIECTIAGWFIRKVARGSRLSYSDKTWWQRFLYNFGSSDDTDEIGKDTNSKERNEKEDELGNTLKVQKYSLAEIQ